MVDCLGLWFRCYGTEAHSAGRCAELEGRFSTVAPALVRGGRNSDAGTSASAGEIGTMDNKPAQNIQDTFLNTVRKDKSAITIYLVSGVKLTGKIRSFDKYSVLLENNAQEQLIFKHAISTVVSMRGHHTHSGPPRGDASAPQDNTPPTTPTGV